MSTTDCEESENAHGKLAHGVILMTGATSNVGRHVVSQLLHAGAAVRALARNPDSTGLPSRAFMQTPTDIATLCTVSAALARRDHAAVASLLADAPIDWLRLAGLADAHRLSGYWYRQLQNSRARDDVPAPILDAWKRYYTRQWLKNERLMAETTRLAQHFAEQKIELLFFKGPLLAYRLYGDIDARAISDIDMLVRNADDTVLVDRALRTLGYQRTSLLFVNQRLSRRFTHQFEYWRGDIPLELHWVLHRHPTLRLDSAAIWQRRLTLPYGGQTYTVLSLEDELLAQILSVPADLQIGKLVVRTFFDIYLLLKALSPGYDWQAFFARRARERTRRLSLIACAVALALFATGDELRELAALVQDEQHLLTAQRILSALQAPRSRIAPRQKLLALSLYEGALPRSLLWWGVSLPARFLVYRSESKKLLRRA